MRCILTMVIIKKTKFHKSASRSMLGRPAKTSNECQQSHPTSSCEHVLGLLSEPPRLALKPPNNHQNIVQTPGNSEKPTMWFSRLPPAVFTIGTDKSSKWKRRTLENDREPSNQHTIGKSAGSPPIPGFSKNLKFLDFPTVEI